MKLTMSRRAFHKKALFLGVTAAAVPLVSPPILAATTKPTRYSAKLRYRRRKDVLLVWMRVRDNVNPGADVPFKIRVSRDTAGQQMVVGRQFVARASDSHIVRAQVLLTPAAPKGAEPLYWRFVVGPKVGTPGRLRTIGKA